MPVILCQLLMRFENRLNNVINLCVRQFREQRDAENFRRAALGAGQMSPLRAAFRIRRLQMHRHGIMNQRLNALLLEHGLKSLALRDFQDV